MARELDDQEAREIIDSIEFDTTTKYPWAQWTNGNWWLIKKGEDYERNTDSMRTGITNRAKRHSMKAEVYKRGDTVLFRFSENRPSLRTKGTK